MGKGNPESADAVIARGSKVFIADKPSNTNKRQLTGINLKTIEPDIEKIFDQIF